MRRRSSFLILRTCHDILLSFHLSIVQFHCCILTMEEEEKKEGSISNSLVSSQAYSVRPEKQTTPEVDLPSTRGRSTERIKNEK